MTKTLKELQEEHPNWCWNCGYAARPGECQSSPSPALAALIAAKREDEARIAQLEETTEPLFSQRLVPKLQSQLTAEQQAHAETKRQLEEVDGEICYCYRLFQEHGPSWAATPSGPVYQKALARQASINRPTDNSPTDDRGEGEK